MAHVAIEAEPKAADDSYPGYGTKSYRAYVLGMLFIIYALNLMDRGLTGLLQDPIKHEFGLTDFQLGLLGGPAFALFYAFLGMPIARWAERWNRISIVALATTMWSGMTVLCGLAVSYPVLLLARMGVGVGEAGCVPPSQSVISDYFPANKRAAAIAIYLVSVPLGAVFAAAIGGPVAEHYGWRWAFLVLGAPGVLIALIFKLTVREPPRTGAAAEAPSFGVAIKEISTKPSFWHIAFGAALCNFVAVGNGSYFASFLLREHHLTLSQVGMVTGPIMGGFSALSVYVVGGLINKLIDKDRAWLARWPAIGMALAAPIGICAYLSPTPWIAIPVQMASALCANTYLIALYTTAQGVVSPRIRATSAALVMLVITIIGYGFGPPIIGALSDFMKDHVVEWGLVGNACDTGGAACDAKITAEGLRYALVTGVLIYLWSSFHFFMGSRRLKNDWVG
jgi:MFS family permease